MWLGMNVRAFTSGYQLEGIGVARKAAEHINRARVKKMIGALKVSKPVIPSTLYNTWTCKQLDAELRSKGIVGRSKATRKADKIALLVRWA